jgi:PIN domain nuclease of toxin-antitoxin system
MPVQVDVLSQLNGHRNGSLSCIQEQCEQLTTLMPRYPRICGPASNEAAVGYSCVHLVNSNAGRLSATVLAALRDPANSVVLSTASVWEMIIKVQLTKLSLRVPLVDIIAQQQANGVSILDIQLRHVLAAERLPAVHKDPFDRLLAVQANEEGAMLVTADNVFAHYPVQTLW